jgi:hypothetical protein
MSKVKINFIKKDGHPYITECPCDECKHFNKDYSKDVCCWCNTYNGHAEFDQK